MTFLLTNISAPTLASGKVPASIDCKHGFFFAWTALKPGSQFFFVLPRHAVLWRSVLPHLEKALAVTVILSSIWKNTLLVHLIDFRFIPIRQ